MINIMVLHILIVALISDVMGASFSNVYVGGEVLYGAPYRAIANSELSQMNSLPPVAGYVSPCGSPCVYPAPSVATVTAVNPNENVLTYEAPVPSVPVDVTPTKEKATGYEYSYVVYDENTGDHKAQRELSDGSVVRGEYSFLQPDGYVREVKYFADDISGFNAVVRNFLPPVVEGKRKVEVDEHNESQPIHEDKNESSLSKEKPEEHSTKYVHYEGSEDSKESKESKNETKENEPCKSEKKSPDSSSEEKVWKESKGVSEKEHEGGSKQKSTEASREEYEEKAKKSVSHSKNKEAHELLKSEKDELVAYKDIIKCIEAAIRKANEAPPVMREEPSPLTYIILNKPC